MMTLERRLAFTYLTLLLVRCVLTVLQMAAPWWQIPPTVLAVSLSVHGLVAGVLVHDLWCRKTTRVRLLILLFTELLAVMGLQLWQFLFMEAGSPVIQLLILYTNSMNYLFLTILLAWLLGLKTLLGVIAGWLTIMMTTYLVTRGTGNPSIFSLILGQTVMGALLGAFVSVLARQQLKDSDELRKRVILQEELSSSWERNRLARELHDTLAHSLSALSVQLEAVKTVAPKDPDKAMAMLAEAHTLTVSGLAETRAALNSLRASPLQNQGLVLALRDLAVETAARAGCTLALDLGDRLALDLGNEREHGLYRMAQEVLQNVIRHSRAKNLRFSFQVRHGDFVLEIGDDGVGFDPQRIPPDRYGIPGLHERACLLGGELVVDSRPGCGCRVRFQGRV